MRIASIHQGASGLIIDLFDPDRARLPVLKTSLQRLARSIGGTTDGARRAVQVLVDNGDFAASTTLAGLAEHKVFELRCDWDAFDASRITIRLSDRGAHCRQRAVAVRARQRVRVVTVRVAPGRSWMLRLPSLSAVTSDPEISACCVLASPVTFMGRG